MAGQERGGIRGEWLLVLLVLIASAVLIGQRVPMSGADRAGVGTGIDAAPAGAAAAENWALPADALLGFVEIPAGPFLMGSDPAVDSLAYDNERWSPATPQEVVELPTYYIGRYEVTVAQFRAFVQATGHNADPAALQGPLDHPVTNVSWPDALAYARWLDGQLRASSETPPAVARWLAGGGSVSLPSEAQWEKAARGTDGRIFPWGDQPSRSRANIQGQGTVPVGSYPCPECPFPVFDMSGNVWEWTRSPFEPYPWNPADLPSDLDADALWVMRGGSFTDSPANARAATRGGADPGARRPFIGFRLALSPP